MKNSRSAFAVFAISLLSLSAIAFHSKSPVIFYHHDGTYRLMVAATKKVWSFGWWSFTSNPLQGLGGMELPELALLEPGGLLAAYLPASIGPTAAMVFYAVVLAVAICWLGVRLGMTPVSAMAAAWLGVLLAMPYVYRNLGFTFLSSIPAFTVYIALDTAAILLFLDIGRGPRYVDAARFAGLAAICGYELLLVPGFAPVSLIVVAFFGLVALAAAQTAHERLVKLIAGVALVALQAAVFGPLLYGMWGFAKPTFFWYEFYPRHVSLLDLSLLIADLSHWPARLIYGLALAGALHAALRGSGPMRLFARGFAAFVLFNLVLVLLTYSGGWKGPRTAYIDVFAFPFYCIFAIHAVAAVVSRFALPLRVEAMIAPLRQRTLAPVVLVCALPWLVLIDYWPPPLDRPLARNDNPFVWPPAQTPLTRFLAKELALRPGSPFRGRVASVAGSDFDPQYVSAPFINQHIYEGLSLFFSGNDHRGIGLWYYHIPTLYEGNQFSSPFFHLVNARLLNAPGALDMRSWETQSVVNERIMALLGVRYLLVDKLLPDRTPVLQHRLVEGRDLFVYSIPAANVAGYSVIETRQVADAQEAVAVLADASMDPRRQAVIAAGTELPPLVPATTSSLTVERGGYGIRAASAGTSLLVLPIEYSHCLRARFVGGDGAPPPRLLRVNLAMAAVLFTGSVEGRLLLRYGPFSSACRIDDWRDAESLRIGEARHWPAAR